MENIKCKNCGQDEEWDIELEEITEYHDGGCTIKGVWSKGDFTQTSMVVNGSWYVYDMKMTCKKCGKPLHLYKEGGLDGDVYDELVDSIVKGREIDDSVNEEVDSGLDDYDEFITKKYIDVIVGE